MSYKIEITAGTTAELAGKLLALAAQMQVSDPVMPEVREAPKPKKAKAEKVAEVTEEPVGEPTAPPAIEASPAPDTSPESDTTTSDTGQTAPTSASPTEALDFEKDVTPLVLQAVKDKGKPWVQEVLSQFGVERASQVPDEQLGELVAILKDAL